MLKLLTSLRTTLALVLLLVCLAAAGSFAIQWRPAPYASIEEGVLLEWLSHQGLSGASAWVWAMVLTAGLLSANACVCVATALARAVRRGDLAWRAAWAHAAHLGFLLVLAGHLLGSVSGFRSDGHPAFSGQEFSVPQRPGWSVSVGRPAVEFAPEGYPRSLSAPLAVRAGARTLAEGVARINEPLFVEGAAVYLREIRPSLRGWDLEWEGRRVRAELGRPLALPGGSLRLTDWARAADGRPAVQLSWSPAAGAPVQGWVAPRPGADLLLPLGPRLRWGEMAVDELGIFDVRYDPGARLALAGGLLLSVSLVPLLRPRRPKVADRIRQPVPR